VVPANNSPDDPGHLASVSWDPDREPPRAPAWPSTDASIGTAATIPHEDGQGSPADPHDDTLDHLADRIAERLAVRLGGLMPARAEALVDAAEIARMHGKTRSWVYQHAGELGAIRRGTGPRPRLGFSPARVAALLAAGQRIEQPVRAAPSGRRGPRRARADDLPLLPVRVRGV
jgi:hypothetical protein